MSVRNRKTVRTICFMLVLCMLIASVPGFAFLVEQGFEPPEVDMQLLPDEETLYPEPSVSEIVDQESGEDYADFDCEDTANLDGSSTTPCEDFADLQEEDCDEVVSDEVPGDSDEMPVAPPEYLPVDSDCEYALNDMVMPLALSGDYAENVLIFFADERGERIPHWLGSVTHNGVPVDIHWVTFFGWEYMVPIAVAGDVLIADLRAFHPVTHIISPADIAAGEITIIIPDEYHIPANTFEVSVFGGFVFETIEMLDNVPNATLTHNGVNVDVPFVYYEMLPSGRPYAPGYFLLTDVQVRIGDIFVAQAPGYYPVTVTVEHWHFTDDLHIDLGFHAGGISIMLEERYHVNNFTVHVVDEATGLPAPDVTLYHMDWTFFSSEEIPRNSDDTFTLPRVMAWDQLIVRREYGAYYFYMPSQMVVSYDIAVGEITIVLPGAAISVAPGNHIVFPPQEVGYELGHNNLWPQPITVTSSGGWVTGAMIVALSGAHADRFVISTTTLPSLVPHHGQYGLGWITFTIVPVMGLPTGTYTATITVSNGNGIYEQIDVSFTVGIPTWGIALNPDGDHTFPAAEEGYTAQTAHSVTVANTGNQPTGALTIELSGTNADSFTLSRTTIPSLEDIGEIESFTVAPNTALAVGTYTATVTVSGGANIAAQTFNVSFTVTPAPITPTWGIALTPNSDHIFPSAQEGYTAQTAHSVTVENTGNQPTGALTIELSGTNADSFTLSRMVILSLDVSEAESFTIVPNIALAVGTYTAT
ncbi:MAG: choice-of-anchor D domain-containing protein, partial [Oscillospiraceae bacterium]|nr:choice-of-anchor D domain-containing protein [Oscillospiraceae bacterium]